MPVCRLAIAFAVAGLALTACGQPAATDAVIGVRPAPEVVSYPAGGFDASDAIAKELARQLQAAVAEGAIPGERALASGQVPLEDFLTVSRSSAVGSSVIRSR